MTPLYFDYAATTPIDDRVIQTMLGCMGRETRFGNPASSSHAYGQAARQAVEEARQQVATLVGSPATALIWTSGATESNNLALKGIADSAGARRHIVSSRLEHKSVLDTLAKLARDGFEVTWLEPDESGLIHPDAVAEALRDDTLLVSLMLVNNELGTLTDIAAVGERIRQCGALLHVDAAQAVGKVAIDLSRLAVDLMSFSAHKIYGPKGIGALYVGERARPLLQAQIHGGGHERGLRSGTLATHQIVGMGAACALAGELMMEENERIARLSARLGEGVLALPQAHLNGCRQQRVPHTLSLRIDDPWFNSMSLSERLAFSSTSACNSASGEPSHVLCAIGLDAAQAARTIRLSIGRYSTTHEIEQVIDAFAVALGNARP